MNLLKDCTSFINAGGRGTRLEGVIPFDPELGIAKGFLQAAPDAAPIIDHQIQRSLDLGYGNVIVSAGDQVKLAEYVGDTYQNSQISVFTATARNGTAGDLAAIFRRRPDFFAMYTVISNVDTLLELSDQDLMDEMIERNNAATIVLTEKKGVPNEGAYLIDLDNKVLSSREFTASDAVIDPAGTRRLSSCGVVALHKTVLNDTRLTLPSASAQQ